MSIIFKPTGSLDVNTDPSDLPETNAGTSVASGSFARCKNLTLDRSGQATTRKGSRALNASALSTINHVQIQAGVRYSFASNNIYRDESSIIGSLTDAQWTSLKYNAFNDTDQQVFCLNGTDRKKINGSTVYEWGIEPPVTAPTVAASVGAGALTGNYSIRYTFLRKVGSVLVTESNPSPASNTATLSANDLDITGLETSTDAQITHIRIYRTTAGGTTYFVDSDITHPPSSTETVNTSDAALGTQLTTDRNRPPLGSFVADRPNYNGTCFIIKDNLLYYCLAKQPEYWPATYFIECGPPQFPGKTLVFYNGQPFYLTQNNIYYIQGTGHGTFQPIDMNARTGAQGVYGAFAVDGVGIYHVGSDGLYLYSGGVDKKITQNNFDNVLRGNASGGIPGATDLDKSWLIQFNNKLYFGFSSTAGSYPTNVLVMQLDEPKKTTYYSYSYQIRCVSVDITNERLIAGCADGFIRELEYGTDDSGTAVSWECQSKDFTLQTRKHFPRWIKYDVEVGSSTVTGQVKLDGAIQQTHTITGSRQTKRRLIETDNGNRCAINVSGTGQSTLYAAELQ